LNRCSDGLSGLAAAKQRDELAPFQLIELHLPWSLSVDSDV
jgi:hypothetical protein